jgi:hypothetical protein
MLVITQDNFDSIREQGIGNGFTVVNPADGYRKDNRLWFGTCETCAESVTNSSLTGKGWEHTVYTVNTPNHKISKTVNYCPATVLMPS